MKMDSNRSSSQERPHMTQVDRQVSHDSLTLLRKGQIRFGEVNVRTDSLMSEIIELLRDRLVERPREWLADNNRWSKYVFTTDILWYPTQRVSFTFRNESLVMIEFSDGTKQEADWDYSVAVQEYLRLKDGIVKHLDKESWCHESNPLSMEVGWDFAKLSVYLTCDVKTGGCSIGIRPLGL